MASINYLHQNLEERLNAIKEEIKEALPDGQKEKQVTVVAVSKLQSKDKIIEAYEQGVRDFGENYVKEIVAKSTDALIREKCPDIRWHFIGHLQSNKVVKLLKCPNVYMIQSIDSMKLTRILQKEWLFPPGRGPMKVMIQVNTSNEESKSGVSLEAAEELAMYICERCDKLDLAGFMTIGTANYDTKLGPNPEYQKLVDIKDRVAALYNRRLHCSMGMSQDFAHAVQIGSTFVRIGERIFGPRVKIEEED